MSSQNPSGNAKSLIARQQLPNPSSATQNNTSDSNMQEIDQVTSSVRFLRGREGSPPQILNPAAPKNRDPTPAETVAADERALVEKTMVLFVGSDFVRGEGAGVGIAYRIAPNVDENAFVERALRVDVRKEGVASLRQIQMCTITHALGIARRVLKYLRKERGERAFEAIVVYCDCSRTVGKVEERMALPTQLMGKGRDSSDPFVKRVIRAVGKLRKFEVNVRLRHVPGRSGVPGNVLANRSANRKGRQASRSRRKFSVTART